MNEFFQNIWSFMTTPNESFAGFVALSPIMFLDSYICMFLFTTVLNIKSDKRQKVLYVIMYAIVYTLIKAFIPVPYSSFVNLLVMSTMIFFIFKVGVFRSIIACILPFACQVLVESLVLKLYIIISGISQESIILIPIHNLIITFSIYLFLYLIYRLLDHLNINVSIMDKMDNKSKVLFIITFVLAIILIGTQLYLISFYNANLPFFVTILSIITLMSYLIISFYSISRNTKLEITSKNLEESQLYNKTLTILHDNIRGFKHDFNNIVQSIGGYVQTDDLDGLKKYYSQLVEDCQKVSVLNVLNPAVINNPAIYSLLTSKYYDADAKGIDFNIDVFLDLNTLNMKVYEFTRILGILLDNAIEATMECEEKIINLSLRLDNNVNRQLLIIENTYMDKSIDTEKIFEKSYSTKPNNTGLGLWEVRKILKKSNNLNLFTTKDDKFFKQQLEIYL